ncbi:uncharacterized protein [Physcomitrium patens]
MFIRIRHPRNPKSVPTGFPGSPSRREGSAGRFYEKAVSHQLRNESVPLFLGASGSLAWCGMLWFLRYGYVCEVKEYTRHGGMTTMARKDDLLDNIDQKIIIQKRYLIGYLKHKKYIIT